VWGAVSRFAATGRGDVKRLQGLPTEFRLRVGKWRVRFSLDEARPVIHILRVLPRGEAYRH
jgi:mRNA interferase RelE/StbE